VGGKEARNGTDQDNDEELVQRNLMKHVTPPYPLMDVIVYQAYQIAAGEFPGERRGSPA
jgi:hypothetical protein